MMKMSDVLFSKIQDLRYSLFKKNTRAAIANRYLICFFMDNSFISLSYYFAVAFTNCIVAPIILSVAFALLIAAPPDKIAKAKA